MTDRFESIQSKINFQFNDEGLLKQALTHRSVGKRNNERLEFLGDGILNFVIAEDLFDRFPDISEGELSRYRSHLVKGEMLAKLATHLQLGDYLLLGPGELKSGGYRRESILADALEAIFGAAYLDSGFDKCKNLILGIYHDAIEKVGGEKVLKDPKTRLQEYLQSKQLPLPEYEVVDVSGEAHNQIFKVSCSVKSMDSIVYGTGSSRRRAEQDAASRTLDLISHE